MPLAVFTFQRAIYSGREKVCETYSVSFILDFTSWLLLYLKTFLFFQLRGLHFVSW